MTKETKEQKLDVPIKKLEKRIAELEQLLYACCKRCGLPFNEVKK